MEQISPPTAVGSNAGLGLRWAEAPRRTEYGAGMMEALVALGKDHTLRLYAEAEALPLVGPALHGADVKILEAAVAVVSRALDELVGACLDADGKPRAPDRSAVMRARSMLQPACLHALKKA